MVVATPSTREERRARTMVSIASVAVLAPRPRPWRAASRRTATPRRRRADGCRRGPGRARGRPRDRRLRSRPGVGWKPRAGSSALMRHSRLAPSNLTSDCSSASVSLAAIRSCSRTRSRPVRISVTGCSTWRRAFISMNHSRPSRSRRSSTVPAPVYPIAAAARAARAAHSIAFVRADDGARATPRSASDGGAGSSTRARRDGSPARPNRPGSGSRCDDRPRGSARGRGEGRRTRPPLRGRPPRTRRGAPPRVRQRRMPRPPPPASALSMTGQPTCSAVATALSASASTSSLPGIPGRPAAAIARFAGSFLPRRSITSGRGPMKASPWSRQSAAKRELSARNPQPG